jgi:hypothetical protein
MLSAACSVLPPLSFSWFQDAANGTMDGSTNAEHETNEDMENVDEENREHKTDEANEDDALAICTSAHLTATVSGVQRTCTTCRKDVTNPMDCNQVEDGFHNVRNYCNICYEEMQDSWIMEGMPELADENDPIDAAEQV